MQIRFADSRPEGDFALVLPVAGKDRAALSSLGLGAAARCSPRSTASASKAKRRARPNCSSTTRGRRAGCSSSARAAARARPRRAEKLGGAAVARLLTSGRNQGGDRRRRPRPRRGRVGAASVLRRRFAHGATTAIGPSSRTSRSRPSMKSIVVGGGEGAAQRYAERWAPVYRRRVADPRAGHRAGQHHLSARRFVERVASLARRHRRRDRGARSRGDGEARHGRAARRRAGLGPRGAACSSSSGTAAATARSRSPSSARA